MEELEGSGTYKRNRGEKHKSSYIIPETATGENSGQHAPQVKRSRIDDEKSEHDQNCADSLTAKAVPSATITSSRPALNMAERCSVLEKTQERTKWINNEVRYSTNSEHTVFTEVPKKEVIKTDKDHSVTKHATISAIEDLIKTYLKPFYAKGIIDKNAYKAIMRKCVEKVYAISKTNDIITSKVKRLVEAYVQKYSWNESL